MQKSISDLTAKEAAYANQYTTLKNTYESQRAEHSHALSNLEALRKHKTRLQHEAADLGVSLANVVIGAAIKHSVERMHQLDSSLRVVEGFQALSRVTDLERDRAAAQRDVDEIAGRVQVLEAARRSADTAIAEAKKVTTEVLGDIHGMRLGIRVAVNSDGQEQSNMGVAVGDYDGDGYLDFFLPHFSDDTPILYRNLKGESFDDMTYAAGLAINTQ